LIKYKRTYGGVLLILSSSFLAMSYIFEFMWLEHYKNILHNPQPQVVEVWNIVYSIILLSGVVMSILRILVKRHYDERLE
jgi:hypothetical protein